MADLATALQRVTVVDAGTSGTGNTLVFNTDIVRQAWEQRQRAARQARRAARRAAEQAGADPQTLVDVDEDPLAYSYVYQLWTDHIIVSLDGPGDNTWLSIPYKVNGSGASPSDVEFGAPTRVKQTYVAASRPGAEAALVLALATGSPPSVEGPSSKDAAVGESMSALDKIVAASAASQEGVMALSAPPWANKTPKKDTASNSSSSGQAMGHKLVNNPTTPTNEQDIQTPDGKKVGTVKQSGGKFTHSGDNHSEKFGSAQGAMRQFAAKKKMKDTGDAPESPSGSGSDSSKSGPPPSVKKKS